MKNLLSRLQSAAKRLWARVKAWARRAWKAITGLVVAIMMSVGLLVTAQDTSVTLSWENATAYENGDPLPLSEIQETRIYRASYPVGQADGSQAKTLIDSVTADITTYVDSPGNGSHCYHATHVAINGGESAPSNEACFTIDQRSPGAPQNLSAQ